MSDQVSINESDRESAAEASGLPTASHKTDQEHGSGNAAPPLAVTPAESASRPGLRVSRGTYHRWGARRIL